MLIPKSEAELAELVATASGPLAIKGGETRGLSAEGQALSTSGLSGITLYEPGALTLVAKSGTPLAEIEAALDAENQMLPFEPYDLSGVTGSTGQSTIGGVIACNASGSRRVQAGAARDFLLGVRFVDGQGDILKNGGRVMKNVTGYDLSRLMCGARGTLGVLSEISLKVLPKPEASKTLFFHNLSDSSAVKVMSDALTSPFEVSGASHAPVCIEEEPTTMIRIEGFAQSVSYRAEKLKSRLAEFGDVHVSDGRESWDAARNLVAFSKPVRGDGALWALSMKASDAPSVMARIIDEHECRYSYDWGGGRVWVWEDHTCNLVALHNALQAAMSEMGGHSTLLHGPDDLVRSVKRFQPEAPGLAKLADGLRQKFDPKRILNPGMMG